MMDNGDLIKIFEKFKPQEIIGWEELSKLTGLKIPPKGDRPMRTQWVADRNSLIKRVNNEAERQALNWRLKVIPTIGVQKISDQALCDTTTALAIKKVDRVHEKWSEALSLIAEDLRDLGINTRDAEKVVLLIEGIRDLFIASLKKGGKIQKSLS